MNVILPNDSPDIPASTFLMPATGRERILNIDILHGFALLGISVSTNGG